MFVLSSGIRTLSGPPCRQPERRRRLE